MYTLLQDSADEPIANKQVTLVMNGYPDRSFVLQYKHPLQMAEILSTLEFRWGPRYQKDVRIFNPEGVEYDSNEDLKYVKENENIYISKGQEFDASTGFCSYEIIKEIGQGGFGKVVLGRHKMNEELVAIKIIKTEKIQSAHSIDQVFREVQNLKALNHPNIVKIHNCFVLKQMQVIVVMEYLEGGELLDYLSRKGRLELQEALIFFKQIASAMNYCHSKNIVHRDLKLQNVLLKSKNSTEIKIADFGIAGVADQQNPDIDSGTLKYMAPEILSGLEKENSPAADIWSMGCIFYYFLYGKLPFVGSNCQQTKSLILQGNYVLQKKILIGEAAEWLISKMLDVNPKTRIKTPIICDELHRIESYVSFIKTQETLTPPVLLPTQQKLSNASDHQFNAATLRKQLRYKRLKPLNILPILTTAAPKRLSKEKEKISKELKECLERKRPAPISNFSTKFERKTSLSRESASFRERLIVTPTSKMRLRSRESIFDIKNR